MFIIKIDKEKLYSSVFEMLADIKENEFQKYKLFIEYNKELNQVIDIFHIRVHSDLCQYNPYSMNYAYIELYYTDGTELQEYSFEDYVPVCFEYLDWYITYLNKLNPYKLEVV